MTQCKPAEIDWTKPCTEPITVCWDPAAHLGENPFDQYIVVAADLYPDNAPFSRVGVTEAPVNTFAIACRENHARVQIIAFSPFRGEITLSPAGAIPVPEPSMLGIALITLGLWARWRRTR